MSAFKFNPEKNVDGPPAPNNGQRAETAYRLLLIYAQRVGTSQKEESNLRDLINDLLHLADQTGMDAEAELEMAISNWRAER